jgi:phosphoribosylformylglycinamidine synthase
VKANIFVTLKRGVLDPQGQAVGRSLGGLGYKGIGEVRVGKFIEVELDRSDRAAALRELGEMCQKLIANTVIEDYRIEVVE